MKQLLLSEREAHVLNLMCELYIKIGLGQLSEVGKIFEILTEQRNVDAKPICDTMNKLEDELLKNNNWKLEDKETSSYVLIGLAIQSLLGENYKGWEWACKQIRSKDDLTI